MGRGRVGRTSLWQRLAAVSSLRFSAQSHAGSGWSGAGTGTVEVARSDEQTLVFTETGTWQTERGRAMAFRNVFRWTRATEDRVRLEHLRFGPDRPVYLFDLVPDGPIAWRSAKPHLCGADRYTGTLRLAGDHLALRWRITGPRKDEHLLYRYHTKKPPSPMGRRLGKRSDAGASRG